MSRAWPTIPFEHAEYDGSPTYNGTFDELIVNRTFMVPWFKKADFINLVVGKSDPEQAYAYCNSFRVKHHPGMTGNHPGFPQFTAYEYAIIELTFTTDMNAVVVGEYMEPSAEFLTLPYEGFKWSTIEGDDLTPDEAPGQLAISTDYVVNWKHLRENDMPPGVTTAVGSVNSSAVNPKTSYHSTLIDKTFAAETMLYAGPVINRTYNIVAQRPSYDVTMRWHIRENVETIGEGTLIRGWNHFFRVQTGKYERIVHADTGVPFFVYPPQNHNTVLKPFVLPGA